nr:lipocalin family protein [uncultured Allomuricauda sp.]
MKKIVLFLAVVALSFSCSNDADDNDAMNSENRLVGTWVLTDLRIDSGVDDDDLDFGKEIIAFLQGIDCDLITFTFNEDGTVTSVDRASFISINVGMNGLDIPCPTESDTENSVWSLEGNQLTFINENLEEETITIAFEGDNTLIIAGEDIDAQNFTGADAVFTRQ